ncbi:MAG: glycosyltransferase family 39 protein [Candidatus Omnitrophota bacterium]|nr:MAG: glycosyltransferase family 39 protein [Candidatus Omnitrophota bacterium]
MIPRNLYIIFGLAVMIKLLSGFFLNAYNEPQIFEYEIIANNMLSGKGFLYNFYGVEYRAFVQPLYPVFTAIIYYLTNHSQVTMLAIQSIVSSLLCFIIYFIAIRFTGKKEALLAAALVAFHPGLAVYSVLKLHTLVFDVFFYLLTVSLIFRFIERPGTRNAILLGAFTGLTLLSRSTILFFVILCLAYSLFLLRHIKINTRIKYLSIILLAAFVVYSPWIIRNYMVFKSVVFTQTSSGENLWSGNNKAASGSAILASGRSIHTKMPQEMREDLRNLNELGQVKYYKNYFVNFVRKNPLLFTQLFMKKFYYFFWFAPHTGILYSRAWLYSYKLYYGIIFFLFLAGLVFALKKKSNIPTILILLLYMLSLAFLHAIVNVDTRHRWTVEPIMIIFASIGFFRLVDFIRGKTYG